MNVRRILGAAYRGLFLIAICALPATARAATWTVTSTADDSSSVACTANQCATLRDAIASASAGDVIQLTSLSGAISLGEVELSIGKSLTISGPGANTLAVHGTDSTVFEITSGTVNISGLTISGGTSNPFGMAVVEGGGITVDSPATLTLNNCTVTGNSTIGTDGGGIANEGTLMLLDSAVTNNDAAATIVEGSTPDEGDYYLGGNGGGIENGGTLNISNSTIAGNTANFGNGGGVDNNGSMTATNVTIAGNSATEGYDEGSPEFSPYYVGGAGGGIHGSGVLLNTIVAGNSASTDNDVAGSFDQAGTTGNNLIGDLNADATGFTVANHDQFGTDSHPIPVTSVLNALGNNGGDTPAMALVAGGPAIDAGNDAVLQAPYNLTTDQRGDARLSGQHVDIGAYEVQNPPLHANFQALTALSFPLTITLTASGGKGALRFAAPAQTVHGTLSPLTGGNEVTYTPNQGYIGTDSFTFTVTDSTGDSSEGTVTITVAAPSLVVDTTADFSDTCTTAYCPLRGAIAVAESGVFGANPTITFAIPKTDPNYNNGAPVITLNNSTLRITANLTLDAANQPVTVNGNSLVLGGVGNAVDITGASVAISGLTISGALANYAGATLDASSCTFSGSSDDGVDNYGTMTLQNCTVSGAANNGVDNTGTLSLINSTVADNQYDGLSNQGVLTGINSTFAGNGLYQSYGYGIETNSSTANLLNTIVANNSADVWGTFDQTPGFGNNLIGNDSYATGFSPSNHDIIGPAPAAIFGANFLANNGGPTQTIALIAGSPAIDAGNDAVLQAPYSLSTDQRGPGYPRLWGKHVDIGAYEYQTRPLTLSLNPTALSSAVGVAQVPAATYADMGGYGALTKVQFCVGTNGAPATSLYAQYLPSTNLLYLFNASNVAVGGFAPGSNNVINTPLGSLNCAATTVSGSGNNLTVNWSFTPTAALLGKQYTYLQASDAGASTAWTWYGAWTVSLPAPSVVSLTPASLSSSAGAAETLQSTYADSGGFAALTGVQLCVGENGAPSTSLYAEYLPATNLLYLFNADNVAVGGFAPGSDNVITTPLGSLNCAATTVSGSGNNLTVDWSITPTVALLGKQYTYLQASDAGASTAWTRYGTWTVSSPAPSVVSLTPASLSSSAGAAETLESVYADSAGFTALARVQLCVGENGAPSTSLYAEYLPATNLLYLFNASNVAVGGFAPGSNNVITTPLGTLNCAATTFSGTGDNLTLNWSISPTAALVGKQYTYLQASDAGAGTAWTYEGTWTISNPGPEAVSVSPSTLTSPAGVEQSLTTTFADPAGASDLSSMAVVVGSLTNATNSIAVKYVRSTNLLYLANSSNVLQGGFAPGSSNTITTTQGTLDCKHTTVTADGDQIIVNWAIIPSTADLGTKAINLIASDPFGQNSGWLDLGSWTIDATAPVSLAPVPLTSSVGQPETLTATYGTDTTASHLGSVALCVGNLGSPAASLFAKYSPGTNLLYLCNASGAYVGGFAPGSNQAITTSLGVLNCAATSVMQSGNEIVVAWNITPAAGLTGTQPTYLVAGDVYGNSSGWIAFPDWTINSVQPASFGDVQKTLAATKPSGRSF